jgi:serine/threonine-protein kinase
MGSVWIALDGALGSERLVAIKTIAPDLACDPHFRRLFTDEARIAARVSHPNVATVFDIGETHGVLFCVMEWVDGLPLRALQRHCTSAGEAIPVGVAVRVVADICLGLHAAHELEDLHGEKLDVVHRDVSPQNILVRYDGVAKLVDFGIAKARDRLAEETSIGRVRGRAEYMAPEQARGGPVDRRTDVWAAGAVLYHLLAERPLFQEGVRDDARRPHGEGCSVGLRSGPLPDRVPRRVRAALAGALRRDAAGRYPTAAEMARALNAALRSDGIATSTEDVAGFAMARLGPLRDAQRRMVAEALAERTAIAGMEEATASGSPTRSMDAGLRSRTPSSVTPESGVQHAEPPPLPTPERERQPWRLGAIGAGLFVTALIPFALTARSPARNPPPEAVAVAPAVRSEAAVAYAGAMQSMCDASLEAASNSLKRALKADPTMAVAHLQATLLMASWRGLGDGILRPLVPMREHVAAATQYRSALGERDATVLDLLQFETAGETVDDGAVWKRWRAVVDRFPRDSALLSHAAERALFAHEPGEAFALLDRAAGLGPGCALPWEKRAAAYLRLGELQAARDAAERCLSISPAATTCLRRRAIVEARRGECEKVEADARAMSAAEPSSALAQRWLARALVSERAPIESVELAARRYGELLIEGSDPMPETLVDPSLGDWLRGNFAAIAARFPAWDGAWRGAGTEVSASEVAAIELGILREAGEDDRAAALADDYLKHLPARVAATSAAARPVALALARQSGRIDETHFAAMRATVLEELRASDPDAMLTFGAETARSPEEARDVLASVPKQWEGSAFRGPAGELGLARLDGLAGRSRDAVNHLRAAAAQCYVPWDLGVHLRATEALGEALGTEGDLRGACALFAEVLARWGDARPRSRTADAARAAMAALRCAGAAAGLSADHASYEMAARSQGSF